MKNTMINQQRRDFLKKTSAGVAGASLSGGVVGSMVSSNAHAVETKMTTVVTAAHWGPIGVVLENGKAVMEPIDDKKDRLTELLKAIKPDNLHSEAITGAAIGNEII